MQSPDPCSSLSVAVTKLEGTTLVRKGSLWAVVSAHGSLVSLFLGRALGSVGRVWWIRLAHLMEDKRTGGRAREGKREEKRSTSLML